MMQCEAVAEVVRAALPDAQVTRVGTLTGFFFSPGPVTNYEDAQRADHARYAQLFHQLLRAGHFLAPSGYETLFVSLAHTDELKPGVTMPHFGMLPAADLRALGAYLEALQ